MYLEQQFVPRPLRRFKRLFGAAFYLWAVEEVQKIIWSLILPLGC